jgi:TrmH family RNA methyltransferase
VRREALELLKDKKGMKDSGMFIVDTEKILGEAVAAGFEIKYFFYSDKGGWIFDKYAASLGEDAVDFTYDSYIERFATVKTHQGFLAVVRIVNRDIKDIYAVDRLVLLDNLQDPGNVGTIIRSGCAFGFNNYLLINCASVYSEKAIRASAGAAFKVYTKNTDTEEIKAAADKFSIIATDVKNGSDIKTIKSSLKEKYMIALSNEGQGITPALSRIADVRVKINYPGDVESLNVAAAAAIMFYELS